MKHSPIRFVTLFPLLLLLALLMPLGMLQAEASTYYYFKTPESGAAFKAGKEIRISFYAGVVNKETRFDAWGRPSTPTYKEMPVTLKVFKGDTELASQEFTYTKAATIETTYTPNTTGKLTLRIYGRKMSLTAVTQELQDSIDITVKKAKASDVKKVKPKITVERTAKKKAVITCTNDGGYGMKIYRAAKKNGKYKLIKTTSKPVFTDKKLSASKEYYYKVRLYSKKGKKTYLSKYSAKAKAGKYSNDKMSLSYSASKGVKISWKKIDGTGYYLVARNTEGAAAEYDVISCEGSETTVYYDTNVEKGKTYYYMVSGFKGDDTPVGKHYGNQYKIKIP